MKILTSSDNFLIHKTLGDGETDLYIRAKIFDRELNDVTPNGTYVELNHVFGGMYAFKHTTGFPVGNYIIVFETYSDSGYTKLSSKYGIVSSDVWVTDFLSDILTEIPDNILLDDDARLDNLNLIPNLANESTLNGVEQNVIDTLKDTINDSDGGAI